MNNSDFSLRRFLTYSSAYMAFMCLYFIVSNATWSFETFMFTLSIAVLMGAYLSVPRFNLLYYLYVAWRLRRQRQQHEADKVKTQETRTHELE